MNCMKENPYKKTRRYRLLRLICFAVLLFCALPVRTEAADGQKTEQTGYTIIVQQGITGETAQEDNVPAKKKTPDSKTAAFVLKEENAQHVLALAVCAIAIIWGGVGVVIYKVHQNRADEEYLTALRSLYEVELPGDKQNENKIHHREKVKYDRTYFFVGQKQS